MNIGSMAEDPIGVPDVLKESEETYEDRLEEMLEDHEGDYVMIQGEQILGYAKTLKEADLQTRGKGACLIKKVRPYATPTGDGIITPYFG